MNVLGFQMCQWSLPFKNRWPPYLKTLHHDWLILRGDLSRQRPKARKPERGDKQTSTDRLKSQSVVETR